MIKRAIFFLLLLCGSCANASLNSSIDGRAVPLSGLQALHSGESNLTQCLQLLGAPAKVKASENGKQFILSYEWQKLSGWEAGLALPLGGNVDASLNFTTSDTSPEFVKLIFDERWLLIEIMQG